MHTFASMSFFCITALSDSAVSHNFYLHLFLVFAACHVVISLQFSRKQLQVSVKQLQLKANKLQLSVIMDNYISAVLAKQAKTHLQGEKHVTRDSKKISSPRRKRKGYPPSAELIFGGDCMILPTYSQIEEILLIAAKMPSVGIKYLSQETGLNANGLYNWSSGRCHLGPRRADVIIKWFNEHRPDVLPAAICKYEQSNTYNIE